MADSRFSEIMKKVSKVYDPVQPEDETTEAQTARNAIANGVNPLIQKYVNPILPEGTDLSIPKQTVADEKRFAAELPEQIAGGTMGSIKVIPSARFGNIMQKVVPEVESLGSVVAKPSMQELTEQASKIGMKKQLDSAGVMQALEQRYGPELAKRKADMKSGLVTPDAYNSFKQEMINKIRRGE